MVDISHPGFEDQIEVVNQTLADIKAANKPVIMVFNKVDAYSFVEKEEGALSAPTRENITLEELKRTWIAKVNSPAQFISATQKLHFDEFRTAIYQAIHDIHVVRYPFNKLLY